MRYVLITSFTNQGPQKPVVEECDDFEEMMVRFTLLTRMHDIVLVIEAENKKVVCHYCKQGKVEFNRWLMDGSVYVKDTEVSRNE